MWRREDWRKEQAESPHRDLHTEPVHHLPKYHTFPALTESDKSRRRPSISCNYPLSGTLDMQDGNRITDTRLLGGSQHKVAESL